MELMDILEPKAEVCGASTNKISNWVWVSKMIGNHVSIKKTNLVYKKYNKDDVGHPDSLCPKLIYELCIVQESKCNICPLRFTCDSYLLPNQNRKQITFADFFCGAGGLSLGFEREGLKPLIANDIDPWFVSTYIYNRPKMDIDYSVEDINSWVERNSKNKFDIDIVCGGAPCQSFSTANRQRVENDPRNNLYIQLVKATQIINPKILIIENVGGILKQYNGIIKHLNSIGFNATHILLNALDYNIPQNRKRVFFLAVNKKRIKNHSKVLNQIVYNIENEKSNLTNTLFDAIGDLPPLKAHDKKNNTDFNNSTSGKSLIEHDISNSSNYVKMINDNSPISIVYNHKARYNNKRDIEIFSLLEQGENSLAESIQHINPYKRRNDIFKDKYSKLVYNTYSKTITAHMRYDCNMYIHPEQPRGLTAREAARVQSFPDNYVFLGNFQRLYQQVGNAVPPILASKIAKSLKSSLNEDI